MRARRFAPITLFAALCPLYPACSKERPSHPVARAPVREAAGDAKSVSAEAAQRPEAPCSSFAPATEAGRVESPELVEISGLCSSRAQASVLYVHNDSGDSARFFAIAANGRALAEFALDGASFVDCEDIALGTGPEGTFVYLGDIGNNAARTGAGTPRSSVQIYRVPEPSVVAGQPFTQTSLSNWDKLDLIYPDRPHDAETLMVDPRTGDLVIVTKDDDGRASVFRAPASSFGQPSVTVEKIASLHFGGATLFGHPASTGGDISPSGDRLAVRTYTSILVWGRGPSESLAQALQRLPNSVPAVIEPQGEALGFASDGRSYFTLSEGRNPIVYRAFERCQAAN